MYTNTSSQLFDDCDVVSSIIKFVNNDSPRTTSGGKSILSLAKQKEQNQQNSLKLVKRKRELIE